MGASKTRAENGGEERPLGGYLALAAAFLAATGGFAAWFRGSGRKLPERPATGDVVLVSLAAHKLSRLIAKDRVTSPVRRPFTSFDDDAGGGEVDEHARGRGLKRAIGELLTCPFCLGLWVASAMTATMIVAPRATRWAASALSAVFISDVLQIAYRKLEDAL